MSGGWTKGVWSIDQDADYSVDRDGEDGLCASGWTVVTNAENPSFAVIVVDVNTPNIYNDEIMDDVAAFVIEAGTVANETGLTPRQLADQNAELLEALIGLLDANDSFAKEANSGASALSGETIAKVNEAPGIARAVIAKCAGAS